MITRREPLAMSMTSSEYSMVGAGGAGGGASAWCAAQAASAETAIAARTFFIASSPFRAPMLALMLA
jgi:hypothetical protein